MRYFNTAKLFEADKSRFIDKNENLTDEQKSDIKDFFKKHPDQENKIDWNKSNSLYWKDFFDVINSFNERFLPKLTLNDLKEGEDYVYITEDADFKYYFIKTYKASVAFASNNIGNEVWSPLCSWYKDNSLTGEETNWEENVLYDYPQRQILDEEIKYGGAKWCISMNHTDKFWKEYALDSLFIFAIGTNVFSYYSKMKYAIQVRVSKDFSSWCVSEIFNAFDIEDAPYAIKFTLNKDRIKTKISNIIKDMAKKQEEEKARKKRELEDYRNSLPTVNFSLNGNDFPFIQVGTRPEGKVFMSKYLTDFNVPFSLQYENGKYEDGCNHWDISLLRQWLNSDEGAGQWYHEYEVEGYKVNWYRTEDFTKEFIEDTPGFLKMLGLSKSDLNPVTNITYTTEGKPIKTVDYVWIPSLSELSTESRYDEGKPLTYWKKLLGDNASFDHNENRIMLNCNTKQPSWYWLRSAFSYNHYGVRFVDHVGSVYQDPARDACRVVAFMCLK